MTIITKEQAEAPGAAAVIQQVRTGVGGQTSSLQLIYTFNYFSILNTGRENVHALTLSLGVESTDMGITGKTGIQTTPQNPTHIRAFILNF